MGNANDISMGPYEYWSYGTGAAYSPPLVAETGPVAIAAVADWPAKPAAGKAWQSPTLWSAAFSGSGPHVAPVIVTLPALPRPGAVKPVQETPRLRLNAPLSPSTLNAAFRPDLIATRYARCSAPKTRPKAIVAVIDDGLPFAHQNFRARSGESRVEFCWLQSAPSAAAPEQSVLFGREILRSDIDAALLAAKGDEDAAYLALGATLPQFRTGSSLRQRASHGAHVMDSAGGFRHGAEGEALDAVAMIAVQLPALTTLDTTGFGKDAFILSALHYIFDRADCLADKAGVPRSAMPLIINFSYGYSGGPHNGRDRLERAMQALIGARKATGAPTFLVLPAGNHFVAALNGEIRTENATGGAFTIPWRIQPDDHTANYLEIWLPKGAKPDGLALRLENPLGEIITEQKLTSSAPMLHCSLPEQLPAARRHAQFSLEHYDGHAATQLWRIVLCVGASSPDDAEAPAAPAGLWRVSLSGLGEALKLGPLACRIQRDESPFGYQHGAKQSYFDDCNDHPRNADGHYAEGDNPSHAFVRRLGTLNGIATGTDVTVVGSFRADTVTPSFYSAAGPAQSPPATPGAVTLSAPADESSVQMGNCRAGTRSGTVVRLSGTSTAAPMVSRALAHAYLRGARPDARSAVADLLQDVVTPLPQATEADRLRRIRMGVARLANAPH